MHWPLWDANIQRRRLAIQLLPSALVLTEFKCTPDTACLSPRSWLWGSKGEVPQFGSTYPIRVYRE